ncbi:PREDICTED: UPF0725 protein At2g20620-like isoform X1 [Camelina sativa]|uniref:UPF0725 protein At2g20620-like isoform X1 n=1 Tax=Camelina sativa TaxID=90675 RepID=A0ABM0V118_CAMSA|nr:PREDICTED: UPF0725 protein At2g20620-like isoform X1 [Camelina sativa]XP_010449223.1 PREDICTED: UPF0725 protein At2g20620-like isoform X1 [Camelina sativa]XP_010449224.1 PREDICTED: UPF0725 protein At2g20620-like isoform X1 [Camelina sativa]XP_019089297.1 PREDICTED: UPF0725 protein At2g20620-like isoform X1 [Camelina sativa]
MGNGMWKQEARDTTEEPPLINEKLEDERPQESTYIKPHVWNLRREDTDYYKQQRDDFALYGPNQHVDLFSRVGLHCYNLQKGTNLKILKVHKCDLWITSLITYFITFEAMDPIGNSSCEFETQVRYAVENIDCLSAITTRCKLKPKTPEEGDKYLEWNKDLVDNFFTGDMPEWMREDALTGRDKLQYYEMKDSELEENEWLHLYAELALFSKWQSKLNEMESAKPFEMKKIVVRTKENVESWKKVKAENAIFYISFKTRCGRDFNCIIRKTTDGKPGHFSLEVKCLM